jgi:hypothetical protein
MHAQEPGQAAPAAPLAACPADSSSVPGGSADIAGPVAGCAGGAAAGGVTARCVVDVIVVNLVDSAGGHPATITFHRNDGR